MSSMKERAQRAEEAALREAAQDRTYITPAKQKPAAPTIAMPPPAPAPAPVSERAARGRRQGIYILPADDAAIDTIADRLIAEGIVSARGMGLVSLIYRIGLRHLDRALHDNAAPVLDEAVAVVRATNR